MNRTIFGRNKEIKLLRKICSSPRAEFLAVYGRRRIGKTYLISEFFKDKGLYFEITGMQGGSTSEQLFQFALEFSRQFCEGNRIATPNSWAQAFSLLLEVIERVDPQKKVILFFDEAPWLASPRSKFLNALEHFWNRYLSRKKNVLLILCGSSASWIIRNIINNRGGLHGRVTQKMRLLPFSLEETEDYLKSRQIELDRKQIIDIYMTIGGVPKYLSYISRGNSAAQIINEICFSSNAPLFGEFENLYRSLFDDSHNHIAIIKTLSTAQNGLKKEELLKRAKLPSGGSSSRVIEDLVEAGFISYTSNFAKKKVGGIFRLIDEYSLFYLTWIEPNYKMSIDEQFWMKKMNSPKWQSWSGTAFEAVCLKHSEKIKKALGISGITTSESGWMHLPKRGQKDKGAQIDLIIDRADKCINLCEIKYSDSEFTIDKLYLDRLMNQKKSFLKKTKTKKTLFTTLITTYGAKRNSHYLSIVDNQLTMDDLF